MKTKRLFPTPSPTVHSSSKLNMAGRINDRELFNFRTPQDDACNAAYLLRGRLQNENSR